jgi:2-dehydropantoate 2-reductase
MRVAVLGAGAVGCFYGGLLARAGHDVTFIGRPAHVDAINAHGLLLDTPQFRQYVPAKAALDTDGIAVPDLVFVSVKSAQTEEVGRSLIGHLGPATSVLSLQNGVDNPERLSRLIAHAVLPAVVYVGSEMAGPGHIRQHGGGALALGRSVETERIASVLRAAGIEVSLVDDIEGRRWTKLAINCAYNAISAIADMPYGPMIKIEGTSEMITNAVQEVIAVARACGISMPADLIDDVLKIPAAMPSQKSSTAQDFARGKPSEIDFLNGYVVRRGRELGIPTPTNHALYVMVKLKESAAG